MSIPSQELFYEGYDPRWILGRDKGPPVEVKPKPPQEQKKEPPKGPQAPAPVELKVPFCCEGCEEKMREAFSDLEGLESVKVDTSSNKVTITGKVKPEECLKLAKKIVRRSEMWPKKKEEKKDGGDGKGGGEKKDDKKKEGGGGGKGAGGPAGGGGGGGKNGNGGGGGGGGGGGEKKGNAGGGGGGGKTEGGGGGKAEQPKKDDPPPPIELKVNVCCEGCAAKLYDALKDIDEVIDVNIGMNKIVVKGKAKPEKVLKVCKKLKPAAELIPPPKKK